MKKSTAVILVFAVFVFCALAKTAAAQCPRFETSGTYTVTEGDVTTFSVLLIGGTQSAPKFNWVVSAGKITAGQGSSVIRVDTAGTGGQTITATVEVNGLSASCSTTASVSSDVDARPQAKKIDEYGAENEESEMARLDNFTIELQNDPSAQGYIIAYGGKKSKPADTKVIIDRMRNYLVKTRGIDPPRIVTQNGGAKEDPTYQLWLVPPGASIPDPNAKSAKPGNEKAKP